MIKYKTIVYSIFRQFSTKKHIMKYLCVAEKNDAAKNISQILSRGASNRREGLSKFNKIYEFEYMLFGQATKLVMTSVSGHLLNYEFSGAYKNWHSVNPVELFQAPIQKFCPEEYQKIKRTLEREIRYCGGLIIWTDCDREGENIGFEIIKVCKDVKPNLQVYRAKFSEITGASIYRAINNLEPPNQNISDAVDVRQELDLRTGAAFTRLQTLRLQKVFPGSLANKLISYGSCQFPTLGFVVERYLDIESFIPEKFWRIKMSHRVEKLTTEFQWKRDRLFDKAAVEAILDICKENSLAKVENIESKPKNKWRPLPLDTVEMEKTISKKLRINAKEVMKVAEKLYTQGLISYPRTETNIFPKELNLTNLVEQQREDNQWGAFANRVLNEGGPRPRHGKKSDLAHPPIHPTKYTNSLNGTEQKVYEYIVRHFLACVSKDAVGHETIVNVDINGEKFTAKGLIILERNYLDVYIYEKWNAKEINNYKIGDTFTPTELVLSEGSTTAPKLLTEADLIALMEKHGIGTDATHAEHIETIKSREYVALQDNLYFVPARLGMGLVEGYNTIGLEISLAKPNLRADFENDLKLISEGRKNPDEVRVEQIQKYREVFETVAGRMNLIDNTLAHRLNDTPQDYEPAQYVQSNTRPVMKCPKCGGDMIVRDRKDGVGKYLACTNFPNCKNAVWFPGTVTKVEVLNDDCSYCSNGTKQLKLWLKQQLFIGEPNPVTLCIGGCDEAVLTTLDIPQSAVKRSAQTLIDSMPNQAPNNVRSQQANRNNGLQTSNRNNSNIQNNKTRMQPPPPPPRPQTFSNQQRNSLNSTRQTTISTTGLNLLPGPSSSNSNNSRPTPPTGKEAITCSCNLPAVLLQVKKEGPNQGRYFYKCANSSCNMFAWEDSQTTTNTNTVQPSHNNDSAETEEIKCQCMILAVIRVVNKEGPNKGRRFYGCSKPMDQSCKFFQWADENNSNNNMRGGNSYRGKAKKTNAGNRKEPYTKKPPGKRKCGICGTEGHTRLKCPNK